MNIQVFGQRGMLGGSVVWAATSAGHTVLIPENNAIEEAWEHEITAPVVINCAGRVKQASRDDRDYLMANAYGPHNLAAACNGVGSRLIHVSTDCVFKGGGPHDESDYPDADDMYAMSKHIGEITNGPHLTIRTSFVGFGAKGLIHDLQTEKSVTVSQNLLWTGHTVDTVAALLVWLAEHPHVTGLLHVPGTEQNRYTLARDLKSRWDLPARLERDDSFVADRRLTSGKWSYLGLPTLPTFEMQLTVMRGPSD